MAGGYLRLRGWQLNDKRVYRLWRLNGLSLAPYIDRDARYALVINWKDLPDTVTTFGPGISCMIAMAMLSRCVV